MENMAAAPPVYILHAQCAVFPEYLKRKHVFKYAKFELNSRKLTNFKLIMPISRLNASDGAEYLFACENNTKMIEWVDKVNFHAKLDPSNQLTSFTQVSLSIQRIHSPRLGLWRLPIPYATT